METFKYIFKIVYLFICVYFVNSSHHTKNYIHSASTFGLLRARPQDIMASFSVVSLFSKVPVREDVDTPRKIFSGSSAVSCLPLSSSSAVSPIEKSSVILRRFHQSSFSWLFNDTVSIESTRHRMMG
jgi:hypothetical protein